MTVWMLASIPLWIISAGMFLISIGSVLVAGSRDSVKQEQFNKIMTGAIIYLIGAALVAPVAALLWSM